MPGRTERRMTSQTPKRERMGRRSSESSFRGYAVQKKVGRASTTRSSRPPSRDRPMRKSRGRQSSDRAGSGQGGRKN